MTYRAAFIAHNVLMDEYTEQGDFLDTTTVDVHIFDDSIEDQPVRYRVEYIVDEHGQEYDVALYEIQLLHRLKLW